MNALSHALPAQLTLQNPTAESAPDVGLGTLYLCYIHYGPIDLFKERTLVI